MIGRDDPAVFGTVTVGARHSLVRHDAEGDEIDLCADALWCLAHHDNIEAA